MQQQRLFSYNDAQVTGDEAYLSVTMSKTAPKVEV